MRNKLVKWTIGGLIILIGFVAKCGSDIGNKGSKVLQKTGKTATKNADEAATVAAKRTDELVKAAARQADEAEKARQLKKAAWELDKEEALEKSIEYIDLSADVYDKYLSLREGYNPDRSARTKLITCADVSTTLDELYDCFKESLTNGPQNDTFQKWAYTAYLHVYFVQTNSYRSMVAQVNAAISQKQVIKYDSIFFKSLGTPQSVKEERELVRNFYDSTYVSQFLKLKESYCKDRNNTNVSCEQMAVYNFEANYFNAMSEMLPEKMSKSTTKILTKTSTKSETVDFSNTIVKFLAAEEERTIEKILEFYSRDILRYYESKDLTFEELMQRYMHIWSFTENAKNEVQSITKINDYTYDLSTIFSYYNTKNSKYASSVGHVRFLFNQKGEIIEIYDLD